MKINVAFPATGCQKLFEINDEIKVRPFYEKRMGQEVDAQTLGDEWAGYVFRISGGNDKQGFPMKQGVLTQGRVRLLLSKGHSCYRQRRTGERKRKSVRGCIVDGNLSVLSVVIVKKGENEIPGLTDNTIPRMRGPKSNGWKAAGLAAALALATGVQSASAGPFTRSEIASLTYEQIKGTGLANTCPKVEAGGAQKIAVNSGKKYKIEEFCLEPTSFQVLEEKLTKNGLVTEAVDTKVTTRQTYVLTGIDGDLVQADGKLAFVEQDGIDYAATTVQLPGGERVPFLFTVKNLVAKTNTPAADGITTATKFAGGFKVPSYRTGLFLDPKGRGTTTGYDQAVALPAMQAGGDEGMFKENNKKFEVLDGSIEFKVTSVNTELGEFGGVFVQKQPSDTDLGSKVPKELLLKGAFFATVVEQ